MGRSSVSAAERRWLAAGSDGLAAGSDGLANAGFVGEEVCASQDRDARVGKRELVQGTSDPVLKPILASVRATSEDVLPASPGAGEVEVVVSTESLAMEKELQVTAHWRWGEGGGGRMCPGPASSGALCLVWGSAVAILKSLIILKEEPSPAQAGRQVQLGTLFARTLVRSFPRGGASRESCRSAGQQWKRTLEGKPSCYKLPLNSQEASPSTYGQERLSGFLEKGSGKGPLVLSLCQGQLSLDLPTPIAYKHNLLCAASSAIMQIHVSEKSLCPGQNCTIEATGLGVKLD